MFYVSEKMKTQKDLHNWAHSFGHKAIFRFLLNYLVIEFTIYWVTLKILINYFSVIGTYISMNFIISQLNNLS